MLSPLINYINDNYGSKRGFIKSIKYKLLYWIGFYRSYKNIDFSKVDRLVFVCSGNICRSPFGEYIAKSKGLNAESYGLHCRGGDEADSRAIHQAKVRGVNMNKHITRHISTYIAEEGDLIIVMEPWHLLALEAVHIKYNQVTLAPLWSDKPGPYLHDPFNSSDIFFGLCESKVEQCVSNLQNKLTQSGFQKKKERS